MAAKKKNKPPIDPPPCLHCGEPSRKVSGRVIYPNRQDLYRLIFWKCDPCGAYVGSHKRSGKPKGFPGNHEVRNARKYVHKVLDPLWRNAHRDPAYANSEKDDRAIKVIQGSARGRVYAWLAHQMGISKETCHVGMFGIEECRMAWPLCRKANYSEIRDWYKANKDILKK